MTKLWFVAVGDSGWSVPAGAPHVAVRKVLSHKEYRKLKQGIVTFRQATKEEVDKYLKDKGWTQLPIRGRAR